MIIYKYIKKEYLAQFKSKGSVRINTLYNLRIEQEKIRDTFEGLHQLNVGSDNTGLTFSVKEINALFPQIHAPKDKEVFLKFGVGSHMKSSFQAPNAYVFCASLMLDNQISSKLGCDAYYKIIAPFNFAETMYYKLNEITTIKCFSLKAVKYIEKIYTVKNRAEAVTHRQPNSLDVCFSKPIEFRCEKEIRIIFIPQFGKEIVPITIGCPELLDYCVV